MTLSWRARATILAWWMALLAAAHLAGLALIQFVIGREISLVSSECRVAPAHEPPAQKAWARGKRHRRAVSGACAAVALSALAFHPLGQRAGALWAGRAVRWLGAQVHASNFAAAVMLLTLCGLLFGLAAGLRQIGDIERLGAQGSEPGAVVPMAYTSGPEPP